MKKKVLSLLLISTMILTACGNKNETTNNSSSNTNEKKETNLESSKTTNEVLDYASVDNINLLNIINTSYASSGMEEDYAAPVWSLEQDYVFEFEASDTISSYDYAAFEVHARADFSDINIAKSEYSNGKITVSGDNGIIYNETGASNNQKNWGSYNKLYLVQYYNLDTGEKLDKPIVTPFSVKHDLASPVATQSVGEGNLWTLSWTPVDGAVKYNVYVSYNENGDSVTKQCETTNTTITISDLDTQKESNNLLDLFNKDLLNSGYDVELGTNSVLNSSLHELYNYFVVVAFDTNGNQSGVSNVINTNDIASMLPYSVVNSTLEVNVNSISDVPTYVDVQMVDNSVKKMLINYHGAETLIYPDDEICVGIKAHVCNTNFSPFLIKIHGLTYDDFMSQVSVVTERQDNLNTTGGSVTPEITLPSSPDSSGVEENNKEAESRVEELGIIDNIDNTTESEVTEQEIEVNEPVVETEPTQSTNGVDTSRLVEIPDTGGLTTYDLYLEAAEEVNKRLQQIPDIHEVIYANTQLEAWIAYSLVTNMEIIPVPVAVYPEAANEEYLLQVLMEAYRQNPTSGMLEDMGMSYELESLVPYYVEDVDTRMNKATQELSKAKQIAATISGSERDKVYAINKYLCDNAEYDFNAAELVPDDGSTSNISLSSVDSFTPYGILCKNYGVCESYAESFALIARFSGLNALMETGYMDGGPHEWNRVQVDGSWCVVDVTNNDVELSDGSGSINGLLNVTDAQIADNFVLDGISYMGSLPATSNNNEYYKVNDSSASTEQEAVDMIAEQLKSKGYAQVRIDFNINNEEDVYNLVYQAYEKSGVTPEAYLMMMGILVVI